LRTVPVGGWLVGVTEVVTRGSGEHEVVADRAEIRVTYAANAADRSKAVEALGERAGAVDAVLRGDAMARAVEVRQRSMHVGDRWDRKRRVGATAQLQLVLRVTDLSVLDDLLAALFSAEPEWLDGPQWLLADETTAVREAQRLAVDDARARAVAYAEAIGGRLGTLLKLTDEGAERPFPVMRSAAMTFAAETAAVSRDSVQQLGLVPQQVTVRAACTVSWSLLD
jgi:uncharacterized protein YggE